MDGNVHAGSVRQNDEVPRFKIVARHYGVPIVEEVLRKAKAKALQLMIQDGLARAESIDKALSCVLHHQRPGSNVRKAYRKEMLAQIQPLKPVARGAKSRPRQVRWPEEHIDLENDLIFDDEFPPEPD